MWSLEIGVYVGVCPRFGSLPTFLYLHHSFGCSTTLYVGRCAESSFCFSISEYYYISYREISRQSFSNFFHDFIPYTEIMI